MDLARSLAEPAFLRGTPAQSRFSAWLCAPDAPPDGLLPVLPRTVPPPSRGSGARHGPVSDSALASWLRWNSQEGTSAPGPGSRPRPPLQHHGQLPPSARRRRPPRPARSREPRILARPCRRRAALSPARGGSALTWESSQEGPPSSPPPAAAAASLSPPCFVLPSTLPNQPTRALRTQLRGGAGRSGKPGSPEEAAEQEARGSHGLLWLREPGPLSQPFFPPCSRAPAEAMCGPPAS